MQKAIIVSRRDGEDELNTLLADGWNIVGTEQFCPSDGANLGNYTSGNILVIVEKE